MHHKRRRRPRRILQKKEELSEELTLNTFKVFQETISTATPTGSNTSKTTTDNKMTRRLRSIPWGLFDLRNLHINLVFLGLLLSIFSSNVQGQPPPLPPAGVSLFYLFLCFEHLKKSIGICIFALFTSRSVKNILIKISAEAVGSVS